MDIFVVVPDHILYIIILHANHKVWFLISEHTCSFFTWYAILCHQGVITTDGKLGKLK
jgi:hypothetical protein